ncbi:MAG: TetR/AcrR family transcriptional regulator [Acidobacteriaceae bacterium]
MTVSSVSSRSVRITPQQERSERRLARFLDAAAELFAKLGFEPTTMQAIADCSGSSIGALYNYFPDKQSVAETLRNQYSQQLRVRLQKLSKESQQLSGAQFAEAFIDCIVTFAEERPAWLNLHVAPVQVGRDQTARTALRRSIAGAFRRKNPSLLPARALLAANVTLQILKAMRSLYVDSDATGKDEVAQEFRKVLTQYLESVLAEGRTG